MLKDVNWKLIEKFTEVKTLEPSWSLTAELELMILI